eukprot:scaffold34925_cov150-Amphora_coffeaeformis.AAC.7
MMTLLLVSTIERMSDVVIPKSKASDNRQQKEPPQLGRYSHSHLSCLKNFGPSVDRYGRLYYMAISDDLG